MYAKMDAPQPYAPMESAMSIYNHGPRLPKDIAYAVLWGLTVAAIFAGGFYGIHNRNSDFFEDFSDPQVCKAAVISSPPGSHDGGTTDTDKEDGLRGLSSGFWTRAAAYLAISFLGSFALGFLFLKVLAVHGDFLIKTVMVVQIVSLAIMGLLYCVVGATVTGIIFLLLTALTALAFYLWRDKIALVAKLFTISAAGLKDNPHLITMTMSVKLLLVVALVPLSACFFFAIQNGELVVNSITDGVDTDGNCYDSADLTTKVDCCSWSVDSWVVWYSIVASLGLLWTVMLAFEIRMFTISGSVSQWYFLPAGQTTEGTTMKALQHALGPSFGSLCLGSLVLTGIWILRQMTESVRNRRDIVSVLLTCILNCIYTLVEYLTKFATIMIAITGESFCEGASAATDVLKRNFMSSYAVWWFPQFVLQQTALCASAFAGALAYVLFYFIESQNSGAVTVGWLCFLINFVVLSFFITLFNDIVDVVYMCYVMDKDRQQVSKPEVHEVYMLLPQTGNTGAAVTQPGGGYAYGAPSV